MCSILMLGSWSMPPRNINALKLNLVAGESCIASVHGLVISVAMTIGYALIAASNAYLYTLPALNSCSKIKGDL